MTAEATDVVRDRLLTPLMAFLMAAINAEVGEVMLEDGGRSVPAVFDTNVRPQSLLHDPDGGPRLSAYRVETRSERVTFGHVDHFTRLQFDYVTPSCGKEQLDARWPLLDTVWRKLIKSLEKGEHPAWEDGRSVYDACGITWVNFKSARKVELFADLGTTFTYPAFRAVLELQWADDEDDDTADLYPALSFTAKIYEGDNIEQPAAIAVAYTELGQIERDADTIEETGEAVL